MAEPVRPARRSLGHDVTRWANAAEDAIARRDEAIVSMRADGASLREIAEAAGLSHGGVAKIIRRSSHRAERGRA